MATKKKGLELVFHLHWNNKQNNGGDKSNILGIYETLNFETFKSYLLKNSGVASNDVKVSYLTDDDQEWVIESQEWYERALSAFRFKARLHEVIHLKLDEVRRQSNDVETQFDATAKGAEAPPEWFTNYMKQFKREVVDEVTYTISANLIANSKDKEPAPPIIIPSKKKPEPSKRVRKHFNLVEASIDKELLKSLKYDRKLEHKLDKLDAKTKKIKEKKHAVASAISNKIDKEEDQTLVDATGRPLMNGVALPVEVVPHMMGGETYLHTWKVVNNGLLPWTSDTELRLTWGSVKMVPAVRSVRCPPLLPGQEGVISMRFEIPSKPGQYESYWNFYDHNVRFGHVLSCHVTVDDPICHLDVKKLRSETPSPELKPQFLQESVQLQEDCCSTKTVSTEVCTESLVARPFPSKVLVYGDEVKEEVLYPDSDFEWDKTAREDAPRPTNVYGINEKDLIIDLSQKRESEASSELQMAKEESVEMSATRKSSGESICEIASEASDVSSGYDVINAHLCEEEDPVTGYVYITIDGNKLPVPKHILRPDFLAQAEEAPPPSLLVQEEKPSEEASPSPQELKSAEMTPSLLTVDGGAALAAKLESELQLLEQNLQVTKSYITHCSATGSTSSEVNPPPNGRLFIFPQSTPGFEVVPPSINADAVPPCDVRENVQEYMWSQSPTGYRMTPPGNEEPVPSAPVPIFEHVPNYQQTPHSPTEQRSQPSTSPPKEQSASSPPPPQATPNVSAATAPAVHILPENLVNGAVNVASSAINTARSVINMIVPSRSPGGRCVNGHWVVNSQMTKRAQNLCILADMGFWDTDLNATLLAHYKDDMAKVVNELLQMN